MLRYVAFLRAINVGGHTVTMDQLRRAFAALGLKEVETFIASGNVIFSSPARDPRSLERKIERRLQADLGYEVKTFLRTTAEVCAIARYEPFPKAQIKSAYALNVGFLGDPLESAGMKVLHGFSTDIDDFHANGREMYWLCRKRQSESRFSGGRLEKALKLPSTWRNVNTIARLAAKYPEHAGA
ncbi:MAG TPA: DUF1697 domain-containing protein [Gemmatimonadales bacterium]|nr:DUF1697 domain-containing protein [Gemmatimonadales bacterium]HSE68171.1 DUF1697 domain-containing protein [Gemmatimonadales bacterium]